MPTGRAARRNWWLTTSIATSPRVGGLPSGTAHLIVAVSQAHTRCAYATRTRDAHARHARTTRTHDAHARHAHMTRTQPIGSQAMDFEHSARTRELLERLTAFQE